MFFEVRTGQFGYDWEDTPSGTAPSYEDLNTNIVSGRARSRDYKIKRNQVLGSLSYLKNGWGGTHNFKFGGEWFRETQTAYQLRQFLQRRAAGPAERRAVRSDAVRAGGLRERPLCARHLRAGQLEGEHRLTLNLGLRFDYYRNFLPEQTHDAFSYTTTSIAFPAVTT